MIENESVGKCKPAEELVAPHNSMMKDVETKLECLIASLMDLSDTYPELVPADLSLSEAARLLGRSPDYVRGLLDSGELLYSEKESDVLVSRADLVEYLAFRATFGFDFSSKPSPERPRKWRMENFNWQDRG